MRKTCLLFLALFLACTTTPVKTCDKEITKAVLDERQKEVELMLNLDSKWKARAEQEHFSYFHQGYEKGLIDASQAVSEGKPIPMPSPSPETSMPGKPGPSEPHSKRSLKRSLNRKPAHLSKSHRSPKKRPLVLAP